MKRFSVLFFALAVVALATHDATAQRGPRGFGRGGGEFGLLQQQSVQDELKLSADQVEQAADAMEQLRESMADFRDLSREERQQRFAEFRDATRQALAKILNDAQQKRLRQIVLQQGGPGAFADPEVGQALALTGDQKRQIESIQDDLRNQARELFQAAAGGDRDEIRKKLESLYEAAGKQLSALLTTQQQAKWKEMLGEPFKGEITGPQFRRRGPGGRRPDAEADQGADARAAMNVFRLASFKPDDDDGDDGRDDDDRDDDGDDDGDDDRRDRKKAKAKKSNDKKARHTDNRTRDKDRGARKRRGPHRSDRDEHARGDHHRRHRPRRPEIRRGAENHAEIWARIARAMGEHARWHGHRPSFHHRGPGAAHRPSHGFAHHRFGSHGHVGPAFGYHAWHRAWQPPRFGHPHGPARFASHRGPGHFHSFASWHGRPGDGDHRRGPGHFDRQRGPERDRPHGPPRDPQRPRSDADGPQRQRTAERGTAEVMERLAQLERSLDMLARQIDQLRDHLRR